MAGEFTIAEDGESDQRGEVLVVCKPDNTVLVHDADGYRPVAWLTRAESVTLADGTLTATDGDRTLRVETHEEYGSASYPVSSAGESVGPCGECGGTLVRTVGAVTCLDCDGRWGLPRDATVVTDGPRCDCGQPRMRVARGERFELCVDRTCESLDERVKATFDREWDCPACGGDLRVLRRGGLLAGCEHYPDCETGWGIPTGTVDGVCDCGLPVFETESGRRCLDADCAGRTGPCPA
jgi:DNA topoisomerase-1